MLRGSHRVLLGCEWRCAAAARRPVAATRVRDLSVVPLEEATAAPVALSGKPLVCPNQYADTIAAEMQSTGAAVDSMPTPTPAMMLVPWPVVDASAMTRTGGYL